MKVQIGREMLLIEGIDERRPSVGECGLWPKSCSHHRPILPFDESIIVGLAGAGFGEVDQQLAEERGHPPIDIFRAIVRMESLDHEGKRLEQQLQGREQIRFTDFLQGTDHLKLCDLIDRIDMIDPFLFVPIPLRDRIDGGENRVVLRGAACAAPRCGSEWAVSSRPIAAGADTRWTSARLYTWLIEMVASR